MKEDHRKELEQVINEKDELIVNLQNYASTLKLYKSDIKYAYEWPKTLKDYAMLLGMKDTALAKIKCWKKT